MEKKYIQEFCQSIGLLDRESFNSIEDVIEFYNEILEENIGIDAEGVRIQYEHFIKFKKDLEEKYDLSSITVIGGTNKFGEVENVKLRLVPGDIISIVGPTGSGKSRLLEDIEWIAQCDTPTKRQILVNDTIPDEEKRFSIESKLVAQLSQNMNFVMDTSVIDFVRLHAESRGVEDSENIVRKIVDKSNELAGERFEDTTALTSLSGGQSRALMIADTAFLSQSPIVLIDEIENAGIDRRKALDLLVKNEKIIIIATHDPILALMAQKRIVIKNGGIHKLIETTSSERNNLSRLEAMDKQLMDIRNSLRLGELIEL